MEGWCCSSSETEVVIVENKRLNMRNESKCLFSVLWKNKVFLSLFFAQHIHAMLGLLLFDVYKCNMYRFNQ